MNRSEEAQLEARALRLAAIVVGCLVGALLLVGAAGGFVAGWWAFDCPLALGDGAAVLGADQLPVAP